jgi:glyoxylase-like metal-dependent hydrolase (beta-lactamase superfamily II)
MGRRVVQLAPQVYRLPTAPFDWINTFCFVEDDGSVTLVDCGLKGAPPKLVAALAEMDKTPADVRRIVLTHAHPDHAGGAATMRTTTGAALAVHDSDATYLRQGKAPPQGSGRLGKVLGMLPGGGFPAAEVDETFSDGDRLDIAGGVLVVHTPGHTPGHVSLLHETTGVLITGDALFNVRGMTYSPAFLCTNFPLLKETAMRLGELDYETAAFTHGTEIRDGARERVREFVKTRRR